VTFLERLIAFDIWVMRTFLGGLPGETISAAAWNARLTGRWWFGLPGVILIDLLFLIWERDHCRKAWEWQQHLYKAPQ
jgi:hypothetical protein